MFNINLNLPKQIIMKIIVANTIYFRPKTEWMNIINGLVIQVEIGIRWFGSPCLGQSHGSSFGSYPT